MEKDALEKALKIYAGDFSSKLELSDSKGESSFTRQFHKEKHVTNLFV